MRYNNNAIKSDDPHAIEKLGAKLKACEDSQKQMKDVNRYYKKYGTCVGFPDMREQTAKKLDQRVEQAYSWEKQPYPSYTLTNNNAEIRRLKQRIEQLTYNREAGFVGWEFHGGEVDANSELNRLQVFFDEKPDEQKRTELKSRGFHWSPTEGAWQRQLNENAIYVASQIDFICPKSGESPLKLQPKAPAKDAPER